ncbi:hypothetical protein Unana1_00563 [Umbelopsis nana]
MSPFKGVHHVAIIAKDYEVSKHFYVHILGLKIICETYREQRQSYKLDLQVSEEGTPTQIELFSFPNPPARPSRPEAAGLRHLCLAVENIDKAMLEIKARDDRNLIVFEDVRVDDITGERFVFFADPDELPIELKQVGAQW